MPSNKAVKQTIQVKMQHPSKKKGSSKMSSPDSISETISFVIKGKLTPIKPSFVAKKGGIRKKLLKLDKRTKSVCKQSISDKKVDTMRSNTETDNSCISTTNKKALKNTKVQSPKPRARVKLSPDNQNEKVIKKRILQKVKQLKTPPSSTNVKKTTGNMKVVKKLPITGKPIGKTKTIKLKVAEVNAKPGNKSKEILAKQESKKMPKRGTKSKVKVIPKNLKTKTASTKKNVVNKVKNEKLESPITSEKETKTDVAIEKKESDTKSTLVQETKEESSSSSNSDDNLEELRQSLKNNESSDSKTRPKEKNICDNSKTTKSKQESVRKKAKLTPKKSISTKLKKSKVDDQKFRKLKLYGYWNGPKRQRVASLNAIAKVHCLYENEGRINMLDNPESFSVKKELLEKSDEDSDNYNKKSEDSSPPPQRNLRYVPGLRGVGKHYDIHNASFSSDEQSEDEQVFVNKKITKVIKKEPVKKVIEEEKVPKKRKRKQAEITTMDLKDMVVRKRMASLNATAILAASYSQEKRGNRSPKSDATTTDNSTESSEEESASGNETETKKCYEDDVKKEDDKLIEVHTKPNKNKVAVILNQDTDVTITGVYVNSTTRSTHHEGYCSIAGMQYRISATSHTQTAATAVATETLLQSAGSGNGAQDNVSPETLPPTGGKPYKPLDALSNMRPPSDGAHHGHQGMGPPQHHVMSMSPGGVRHSCSSAFSAPHPNAYHHPGPTGHHGPAPPPPPPPSMNAEPGYIHGYYQPAGPLITVPHGHGQPPLAKSAPLSEISPTTPSPLSSHIQHPAPSSNGGDSSDSEVIITSVTAGKDVQPPPPPPQTHGTASYRTYSSQYHPANVVPPPPSYSYPYSSHYYHPTPPPPPPQSYAPPPPHDVCYSPGPYVHHKFSASAAAAAAYRRYLGAPAQYYHHQTGGGQPSQAPSQDIYAQPSQQVVTTTPGSGTGSAYQPQNVGPLPPTTLMEPYPPAMVESYYYPGYPPGPPSSCYSHAPPPRAVPFINGAYQSCPCPMQSCPKNGLTGPLTGDSKRSNTLPKSSMPPLPPVALALPKEPTSDGPPSPARGSAGMPPPPSPAGATYHQHQATTPPTKQESISPQNEVMMPAEGKRKARVGKAMVRSNIMQNTMLLMCNPIPPNCVKREIESPKEKEALIVPEKDEIALNNTNNNNRNNNNNTINDAKTIKMVEFDVQTLPKPPSSEEIPPKTPTPEPQVIVESQPVKVEDKMVVENSKEEPELEPVISTVGENVKVKNMKRKLSMSLERKEETVAPSAAPPPKKQRTNFKINGSYKNLIKKNTNTVRINNGKRKLIQETTKMLHNKLIQRTNAMNRRRMRNRKRKLNNNNNADGNNVTVDNNHKKSKREATLPSNASSLPSSASKQPQSCAEDAEIVAQQRAVAKSLVGRGDESEVSKRGGATTTTAVVARSCQKLLAPAILDNLIAKNNVDRTIECVISDAVRTKNNNNGRRGNVKINNNNNVNNNNNNIKVKKVTENKNNSDPVIAGGKRGVAKGKCGGNGAVAVAAKGGKRRRSKCGKETAAADVLRSLQTLKWSNGWSWEGESYEATVFLNSDETTVVRRCYPSMRHHSGDLIEVKDCVLLKAGARRNELPFVAKIAALWENPEDGEMMMSLLWYYRPEHTEQGRLAVDQPDEVFASRHKDSNSVACIDDKCFVLTFNEYCRYRKRLRRLEEGIQGDIASTIPLPEPYPRSHRQPPSDTKISPEMIFFCRRVYDFRQKRIVKNPN